ncbi:MAG: hypothetical protein H5T99_08240 [Moorella sp. (in: Bacteria)]|nr:hypothetical protein [Moorella sp. (in: firmicutes)]
MRIMWFISLEEAIDLAERMAADNGCTARKEGCAWEAYNPACPEANAVIIRKARQYEPNGPEGYEVVLCCNVYRDQEKWPRWLAERGVTPGRKVAVGCGLPLRPAGEVVVAGNVTGYQLTEAGTQKIWDAYGPPRPRRETRRPLQLV